jgi:hypothetical protein
MRGHGSKFGRRKELAIAALISNRTHEEAANEAGISVRTLIRWMKIPEFHEEWLRARRDVVGAATARVQNATGAAAAMLLKTMVDPNASPATHLRAIEAVFNIAHKGFELEDLDIRVARLERSATDDQSFGSSVPPVRGPDEE